MNKIISWLFLYTPFNFYCDKKSISNLNFNLDGSTTFQQQVLVDVK